jgi:hypothetical protein
MRPLRTVRWRVRLKKTDSTVSVGGYYGSDDNWFWVLNEHTGEVMEIPTATIAEIDILPY